MTIKTYSMMNKRIVGILRWDASSPMTLYAAQRIEELEAEVERLQCELHDEQVRCSEWEKMYNQAISETAADAQPCGHQEPENSCEDCGNQGSVALFGDDPATGNALCWACEGYKENVPGTGENAG